MINNINALPINQQFINGYLKQLSDTVGMTFTPNGGYTLIQNGELPPRLTKDGCDSLMSIIGDNSREQMFLASCKSALAKTAFTAGDGTTTSIYLMYFLHTRLWDFYKRNKSTLTYPQFKSLVNRAMDKTIEFLDKTATQVRTREDILNIVKISLNNDDALTEIFSDLIDKLTSDGEDITNISIIHRDDHRIDECKTDVHTGLVLNKPLLFSNKSTIIKTGNIAVFYIDSVIDSPERAMMLREIMCYVLGAYSDGCLVITNGYSQYGKDVISSMYMDYKARTGGKTPNVWFGENQRFYHEAGQLDSVDLVAKLGVTPVDLDTLRSLFKPKSPEEGISIISSHLGKPSIANMDARTWNVTLSIIAHGDGQIGLQNRINYYKSALNDDDLELTKMQKNLYNLNLKKLEGKVGVIRVGAISPEERTRLVAAFEDATLALKYSLAEGYVSGMSTAIPKAILANERVEDELLAEIIDIFRNAYVDITSVILNKAQYNTGDEEHTEILSMIAGSKSLDNPHRCFDVITREYTNNINSSKVGEVSIFKTAVELILAFLGTNQMLLADIVEMRAIRDRDETESYVMGKTSNWDI
ncbi:MAG: TCP-1/cpn60 chaperonin family protein [Peptostreptococcaceae bacterium]